MSPDLLLIDPAAIFVKRERLRPLNPELVDTLAESMKTDGLKTPIIIRLMHPDHPGSGWYLIAGYHRWLAAKKLGWDSINCLVEHEWLDDDAALRVEIIENLKRGELTGEERNRHIAELLKLDPTKSDRLIAKEAGVTHPTIAKVRAATGKVLPVGKRLGADGKERRLPAKPAAKAPLRRAGEFCLDELTTLAEALAVDDPGLFADFRVWFADYCANLDAKAKSDISSAKTVH